MPCEENLIVCGGNKSGGKGLSALHTILQDQIPLGHG